MSKLKSYICFVVFFIGFTVSIHASNPFYTTYNHSMVTMTLCYNYSYIPLKSLLAYKGMAEIVNTHAEEKLKEGKLDSDKKINIHFGCTIFGGIPSVEMYRSKHEYYISLHEWPDLPRLIQIIDYFASPEWESLVYENQEHYVGALNLFNSRLEKYASNPDLSPLNKSITVYTQGDLQIVYKDEGISVVLYGNILPVKLGNIYPVRIKDRYLVFGNEEIWVYENNELILQYPIPSESRYEDWNHDYYSEVYRDWVNVYANNQNYPVFSYHYSKNKLYTIK